MRELRSLNFFKHSSVLGASAVPEYLIAMNSLNTHHSLMR